MALTNVYVLPTNRIPDLFRKIQDGQAPERFTIQVLKDWGFTSTNDRAFIPLLKALGFLTADGTPTRRYLEFRDHSRSKQVLGQGIREAYDDLFLINEHPKASDRTAIEGKFKSFHNANDRIAGLMARTFFGLLSLADLSGGKSTKAQPPDPPKETATEDQKPPKEESYTIKRPNTRELHYNIQIHLPPTKDVEVYNAIFKSLKEHLFD
jgi:hypothetical protein